MLILLPSKLLVCGASRSARPESALSFLTFWPRKERTSWDNVVIEYIWIMIIIICQVEGRCTPVEALVGRQQFNDTAASLSEYRLNKRCSRVNRKREVPLRGLVLPVAVKNKGGVGSHGPSASRHSLPVQPEPPTSDTPFADPVALQVTSGLPDGRTIFDCYPYYITECSSIRSVNRQGVDKFSYNH